MISAVSKKLRLNFMPLFKKQKTNKQKKTEKISVPCEVLKLRPSRLAVQGYTITLLLLPRSEYF